MFKKILELFKKKELIIEQNIVIIEDIIYPTKEMIIFIHNYLINAFKDINDNVHKGILSHGNIENNIIKVKIFVGNRGTKKEKIMEKSFYLLNNFVTSHAFVDGNKRIAFVLFLLFLMLNNIDFHLDLSNYMKHSEFIRKIAMRKTNDLINIIMIKNWFEKNNKN